MSKVRLHTAQEDKLYSRSYHPKDDILDNEKRIENRLNHLGHGGPIVKQVFDSGDYCHEADDNRKIDVELRCCTEEEIDHWLESKKSRQKKGTNNKDQEKKEPTPLAVLVAVHEDETCVYRSRVCTPLLCPKPVAIASASASSEDAAASSSEPMSTEKKTEQSLKDDPLGSLLTAIFGDGIAEQGEIQVYFPDDDTGAAFEELIAMAEDGVDFRNDPVFAKVKDSLRKAKGEKFNVKDIIGEDDDDEEESPPLSNKPVLSVMEVKEGESVREILDKTLGKRPCLMKNLGW